MEKNTIFTKDKEFAVILKKNVVVHAFNYISNNTQIGEKNTLRPFNDITSSKTEANCLIAASNIENSEIKNDVKIGPMAHLRPHSVIEDNVKIGNFVEVKNSTMRKSSKASHMSYIGDGDVGEGSNIGCGTIFCNYDGKNKNKTILHNNVFVGSNCNLVAPIEIGENALIGAGSTITENVPSNALSIARARQVNKENYERKF